MKINVEIDCTPEEARAFLGLPDVAPMQARLMEEVETRLMEAVRAGDPKALLDQWLPVGVKGMEQWQTLWTQMAAAAAGLGQKPRK